MIYNIDENIPMSAILLKNNGTPDTGKTALMYIFNDNTNAFAVNGGTMTEIGSNGYYFYNFVHGVTVNTTFTYYVLNAGTLKASGKFRVMTNKKDLTDTIDLGDGRAI